MSAALILVPEAERSVALFRYRMWLAGREIGAVIAAFRTVWERIRTALMSAWEGIKRLGHALVDLWRPRRPDRFAAACRHYGVRRVTARQYRAYRRHLARGGAR